MGGIMMSLVKEVTMAPKAPAIITAVASSSTLPFMINALNSFSITHKILLRQSGPRVGGMPSNIPTGGGRRYAPNVHLF